MRKLLIAESAEDLRFALEDALCTAYRVKTCANGKEAKNLILSFRPDILILDMLMPELDGFSIMYCALQSNQRPMVLATTRYINDYILHMMTQMGVGYAMVKPCDLDAVAARVGDLRKHLIPPATEMEQQLLVSKHLQALGMGLHLDGYQFLRVGIPIFTLDPRQRPSKELYITIARVTGFDNAGQVEHSIRKAVEGAWEKRDDTIWRTYFRPNSDGYIPKPTNRAFICCLSDKLSEDLLNSLQ